MTSDNSGPGPLAGNITGLSAGPLPATSDPVGADTSTHTTDAEALQRPQEPLDAALAYARQGWAVFPVHGIRQGQQGLACTCQSEIDCPSPGKHPRTPNGLKDATSDAAAIARWWGTWPNANVAVRTGSASGIVAVDLDLYKNPNALAELEARGALPETTSARTGGGGLHLIYAHPGPHVYLKNSESLLAPGVDTRGDGGYIIVPPSAHTSGRSYQWDMAVPAAPLAEWIVAALTTTPRGALPAQAAPQDITRAVLPHQAVPYPQMPERAITALYLDNTTGRHVRLFTAALALMRGGYDNLRVAATLLESPPGSSKVQERGGAYLWRHVILPARAKIEQTPGGPGPEGFRDSVIRHYAAAEGATWEWVGRDARRRRRVLWNFQRLSLERGGGRFTGSMRDLGDVGPETKTVVGRTYRELVNRGWLEAISIPYLAQRSGPNGMTASRWRLTIPEGIRSGGHSQVAPVDTGNVPESDPWFLAGHAAVRRTALGVASDTLRLLLVHGPRSKAGLMSLTGLGSSQQHKHLDTLAKHDLIQKADGIASVAPHWRAALDRLAERTGAAAAQEAARERHRQEREDYRFLVTLWYTCCNCGAVMQQQRGHGPCEHCHWVDQSAA